ncbi:hypothetical protein [Paraferrimonas sp. SM1919]|uniref:hypothetical protein n=1 Tax=Paraferrimonas sp. SM1919 TaxID=2662263 RepID=UPI0013D01657|nr:hypothetical protein [Paraferrimonas sp. SM1919]
MNTFYNLLTSLTLILSINVSANTYFNFTDFQGVWYLDSKMEKLTGVSKIEFVGKELNYYEGQAVLDCHLYETTAVSLAIIYQCYSDNKLYRTLSLTISEVAGSPSIVGFEYMHGSHKRDEADYVYFGTPVQFYRKRNDEK